MEFIKKIFTEDESDILLTTKSDLQDIDYEILGVVTATAINDTKISSKSIFDILKREAKHIGADAVIKVKSFELDESSYNINQLACGTAIKFIRFNLQE